MEKLFQNYWKFLQKRDEFGSVPRPVVRWFPGGRLNPIQKKYFDFVADSPTLLDFGAGDLSLKKKFLEAGFRGQYFTCDLADDYQYDFATLDAVVASGKKFDAIMALEVIEHIPLNEFRSFLPKLLGCLAPGGRLVVSTPNAHAITQLWAMDWTHVHSYPLPDLWAMLTLQGFECQAYRVLWTGERMSPGFWLGLQIKKVLTRLLGVDYAPGVALLCKKSR